MTEVPSVNMRLTELTVSALAETSINHSVYAIQVSWRGGENHAVMHLGYCLGVDGTWEFEPSPSSREDDWIASHRFDYQTAVALAVKAAPGLVVNGRSAAEVAEREAVAARLAATAPWGGEGCCKAAYDSEGNVHDHPVAGNARRDDQ